MSARLFAALPQLTRHLASREQPAHSFFSLLLARSLSSSYERLSERKAEETSRGAAAAAAECACVKEEKGEGEGERGKDTKHTGEGKTHAGYIDVSVR